MQLTQSELTVKSGTSSDPAVWMDRLTALFRACSVELTNGQPHPCRPIIEEVWPIVAAVVTKYQSDTKIMERTCRCVRFMIRCVSKFAASILSPLVSLCVQIYHNHHQSCFIYLGSVIVDEFGTEPSYHTGLLAMLQAFAEVCFPILAAPNGLVNNPDTVDDIFRLCCRFLQHLPMQFLASPVATTVIQCSLAACVTHHRDAFNSVMKFFRDLLRVAREEEVAENERLLRLSAVNTFISQNGQTMVDGLVVGFITLPTYMITESSEVIWALLEHSKDATIQMLQTSIEKLPVRKTMRVTAEQQATIIIAMSQCATLDQLYPVIKDLARLYR
jgi:transportin-3